VSTSPKHLTHFEGGNALSAFRAQALLPRLQAVQPRISAVSARHVHWVWSEKLGLTMREVLPGRRPLEELAALKRRVQALPQLGVFLLDEFAVLAQAQVYNACGLERGASPPGVRRWECNG